MKAGSDPGGLLQQLGLPPDFVLQGRSVIHLPLNEDLAAEALERPEVVSVEPYRQCARATCHHGHAQLVAGLQDLLDAVERYGDRRFYDEYRYKNGRFAPKGRGTRRGYEEPPYYHQMPSDYREWENLPEKERMRDLDLMRGRMYFSEPISDAKGETRDRNEGRSGLYRKAYMESKELHKGNTQQDKEAKIKELEKYMKELSEDMAELVADMSPEERTMAKTKLTTLVSKM